MDVFKPKSLSEMNAEFAQKIARAAEENQANSQPIEESSLETQVEQIEQMIDAAQPVQEQPSLAEEIPAEETDTIEFPAEEVPAEESPAPEAEANEAPAEETIIEETPADEESAEEAFVEAAPVEKAPAPEAEVIEAPVEEAPAEAAPIEETPAVEPEEEINLFEDIKLPILDEKTGEVIETTATPVPFEHNEPIPTGYFDFPKEPEIAPIVEEAPEIVPIVEFPPEIVPIVETPPEIVPIVEEAPTVAPIVDEFPEAPTAAEEVPVEQAASEAEPKFDFERVVYYPDEEPVRRKKGGGAKLILNIAIIGAIILSLLLGMAAFMTAEPGRFIFGNGLLACENTVENTNIKDGMLVFVQKAEEAANNEFVAVHQGDIKEYKILPARSISEQDIIFAIAKREIPFAGKLASLISDNSIIFAVIAVLLIGALVVVRIVVGKRSKDTEPTAADLAPRRKPKKEVLDI